MGDEENMNESMYAPVANGAGSNRNPKMTLQALLTDARDLVYGLRSRDNAMDSMLSKCQTLNETINCMKEYQQDLHDLNNCHQNPRQILVHSLQQENKQIRFLKEENRELKVALEDHEAVMGLLMQQHRTQVLKLRTLSKLEQLTEQGFTSLTMDMNMPTEESQKMNDFAAMFSSCLEMGEESSYKDLEELAQLKKENATLRELLEISSTFSQDLLPSEPDSSVTPVEQTPLSSAGVNDVVQDLQSSNSSESKTSDREPIPTDDIQPISSPPAPAETTEPPTPPVQYSTLEKSPAQPKADAADITAPSIAQSDINAVPSDGQTVVKSESTSADPLPPKVNPTESQSGTEKKAPPTPTTPSKPSTIQKKQSSPAPEQSAKTTPKRGVKSSVSSGSIAKDKKGVERTASTGSTGSSAQPKKPTSTSTGAPKKKLTDSNSTPAISQTTSTPVKGTNNNNPVKNGPSADKNVTPKRTSSIGDSTADKTIKPAVTTPGSNAKTGNKLISSIKGKSFDTASESNSKKSFITKKAQKAK